MRNGRTNLPQLDGRPFLTDGGIETTLIFLEGIELPHFAAFDLMKTLRGKAQLRRYFERYMAIARKYGAGFVLESPTWRANADWGERLGYSKEALDMVNRECIEMLAELRGAHAAALSPFVISGCIGPRGDGYDPGRLMRADEAQDYHSAQIACFAGSDADMIAAFTMTNTPEAIGIARAAKAAGIPSAISFTLETDGRLPAGESLAEAIAAVDGATGNAPAYYMINCAHPVHFMHILAEGGPWLKRLRGLRANASRRSHAELNDCHDLDSGDPVELGVQYRDLLDRQPQLAILGGCCGTDHRHLEQIGQACMVTGR